MLRSSEPPSVVVPFSQKSEPSTRPPPPVQQQHNKSISLFGLDVRTSTSVHAPELEEIASLERMVTRLSMSASTRACSQDLVKYARSTPEPFALGSQRVTANPWVAQAVVDPHADGRPLACCTVQ